MAFSQFDRVPNHYGGTIIQKVKDFRLEHGKRALNPTRLTIGELEVLIPRHFGFCFGVERAIHMAFSALDNHPDKRINLVSEIIHNPLVNHDLRNRGIRFMHDGKGNRTVPEDQIEDNDIVLIPAFGATLEMEDSLQRSGIDLNSEVFREQFDTTCPFVSKVWRRGEQLGLQGYTILIHGKFHHEETRATHSHTEQHSKTLVVLDRDEALLIHDFILGKLSRERFDATFESKGSKGFDPDLDLQRVAVVNQTTMLAAETQEVAAIIKLGMQQLYGDEDLEYHFADTSDTLCYATNENQRATQYLLNAGADLAVIVGGYNSSNTSHLVEICRDVMPTYLVESSAELLSSQRIRHFDIQAKERIITTDWLPRDLPVRLAVTSGASCPDVLVNQVISTIAGYFDYGQIEIESGLEQLSLFGVEDSLQ